MVIGGGHERVVLDSREHNVWPSVNGKQRLQRSQPSNALKQAIQSIDDGARLVLEIPDFLAHQATRHCGQELRGHQIGGAVDFEYRVENFRRLWRCIKGQQRDHDTGVEVVQQVRLDVQQIAPSLGVDVDMKPRHVQKLRYWVSGSPCCSTNAFELSNAA